MSIDRVATNNQAQYFLSQIVNASQRMNNAQQQVASGKVSSDYAGIGGKTSALEAARASAARAESYKSNTKAALSQVDLQDTQLSELSKIGEQLHQAMMTAVGNNDATGLMDTVKSVFDEASQILNAKDANGNYLFGGDKDDTPPFTATSLSDLASLPGVAQAFANGTQKKSVMVADGQPVQIGILASDAGAKLMQALKDIAGFDAGATGGFDATLTDAQSTFLSGEMGTATDATQALNVVNAGNGIVYQRLNDAADQQDAMSTLYKGFVSNIENVDMGTAITQLNQSQIALQAALQVTAQLGQITLLNYLPR